MFGAKGYRSSAERAAEDYRLFVDSSWNVMTRGDPREGKWRGNWRMEWVASTLHTTSEHGVSSNTAADAHASAASSRQNWRPRWFKWTRPFRRKTKFGFCACAITFQLADTEVFGGSGLGQRCGMVLLFCVTVSKTASEQTVWSSFNWLPYFSFIYIKVPSGTHMRTLCGSVHHLHNISHGLWDLPFSKKC